jgi:hypothetical protein
MIKKKVDNNIPSLTLLTDLFDYGFWLAIIIGLCILTFPKFRFDFVHLLLIIVIAWLSVSLILLKKFTTTPLFFSINHNPISLLKEKFPGTYIKKTGNKTFEIDGHFGLFFRHRRITIFIEKDRLNINILTLGQFDIPSVFHAIPNMQRAKKLAEELARLLTNNGS